MMENGGDPEAMDKNGLTPKDVCCNCCDHDCADKCKLIQGILKLFCFFQIQNYILLSKV